MKAKIIIEFSEEVYKEFKEQFGVTTAEELQGALKCFWANEIGQIDDVDIADYIKLSVEEYEE